MNIQLAVLPNTMRFESCDPPHIDHKGEHGYVIQEGVYRDWKRGTTNIRIYAATRKDGMVTVLGSV